MELGGVAVSSTVDFFDLVLRFHWLSEDWINLVVTNLKCFSILRRVKIHKLSAFNSGGILVSLIGQTIGFECPDIVYSLFHL